MRFIVDIPKSEIIETLVKVDGLIENEITNEDLCDFIYSSIGLQVDGLEPKTKMSVMVWGKPTP